MCGSEHVATHGNFGKTGGFKESRSAAVREPLARGAEILDAVFTGRPNRFVVEAELPTGETIRTHCADRGRLVWLLPGTRLLVGVKPGSGRKTGFQAAAAWNEGAWASLDTHLPNRLVERALLAGALPPFAGWEMERREARLGGSRLDFLLSRGPERCWLEVKSVGMSHAGVARFPDAPTARGVRHLGELSAAASGGVRAALVFVAQHAGAEAVAPWREIDPALADALADARRAGVEVYAYRCPITRDGITLGEPLPVLG